MLLVLALWQLAFGCDCADGQLARERGQSSPFGAWLDQVADFGSHVAVFGSFAAFLARSVSVSLASTALLTAFVLGANLLGLFASSQRNSLMASVPAVDHGQSRLLALAMQARHLTDYGAFLLIASLLLLVPSLLAFFLLATGVLTTLLVISQATLHWSR
jgi:phosphatidylglycerophosphate synthase